MLPGLAGIAGFAGAGAAPTAISFVGAKVRAYNGTGGSSIGLSDLLDESGSVATLQEDDLLIVTYAQGTAGTDAQVLVPTNFTQVFAKIYANDTNDTNFQVSYRFMGAVPDTTIALPSGGGSSQGRALTVIALRGVDTTSPFDVAATTASGIDTGRPTPPAITPVTAGAWITVHGGAADGTIAAFTNPGDMDATTNHFLSTTRATTVDAAAGAGIKSDWVSGAFTPATWGGGVASATASWAAATIAWKPA